MSNESINTILDESLTDIDSSLMVIREELKKMNQTLSNTVLTIEPKTKFLLDVVPQFVFSKGMDTNQAIKEALEMYDDILRYKSCDY